MPYKLRRLKKEALESCRFRQHNMTKFKMLGGTTWESNCKGCGMSVQVDPKPLPNSIDIGGSAVALTCTAALPKGWDKV